ncbi:MAG: D-alanine--D-alanine ligase [Ignavibacteriaceae bacterium]|nr:D-alanine--D-alanine ligase [Ignavibacteriaceae bacterium]
MRILVISGGSSEEREISKRTSAAVYSTLLNGGHQVTLFDPALASPFVKNVQPYFETGEAEEYSATNFIHAVESLKKSDYDIAFIGLHGHNGEDGVIQSLLELKQIPYTGSGVMASALSMDKHIAKSVMHSVAGIDVPKGFCISSRNTSADILKLADEITGYPVVVKPNDQGSTVGLTICKSPAELHQAFELAGKFSTKVLFEEFIPGRELTVGVVEGWELPVVEIKPKHDLYDYECKYTQGMTDYFCPADLPEALAAKIVEAGNKAFHALGCEGYGRADFRLTPDGRFSCLEMNSLPGMTATSLLPKMAQAKGFSFLELIEQIIKVSLK